MLESRTKLFTTQVQGSLFFPVLHEVSVCDCTSYYYSPCSSSFSQTPEVWSHGRAHSGSVVCLILKGELPRFPEFFICLVLFSLQILCLETQSYLGSHGLSAWSPQCRSSTVFCHLWFPLSALQLKLNLSYTLS